MPELAREARQKELQYFEVKKVWELRDSGEAVRRQGKPPISVRWVDVNKGDDNEPNSRSRLVAREIRRAGEDPIVAPRRRWKNLSHQPERRTAQWHNRATKSSAVVQRVMFDRA